MSRFLSKDERLATRVMVVMGPLLILVGFLNRGPETGAFLIGLLLAMAAIATFVWRIAVSTNRAMRRLRTNTSALVTIPDADCVDMDREAREQVGLGSAREQA